MRILGIYLENIRSYKKTVIILPPKGITVIHGEVGSGKTSLLMAMEFALLGLGSGGGDVFDAYKQPRGADLLRVDSQRGRVRLLVQIGSKLYVIERRIEKRGDKYESTVGIVEEAVIEDGEIKPVNRHLFTSRGEIDDYIVKILGIREKKKERATPLVYTTAIYVPQFNVQEVLSLDRDKRIEVIERSLGLDKYKLFKANAEALLDKIRKEKIRSLTDQIESMRRLLRGKDKEKLLKDKEEKQRRLDELKKERDRIEQEVKAIEKKRDEALNMIREVEKKKAELLNTKKTYEEKTKQLARIREELQMLLKEYGGQASVEDLLNQFNIKLRSLGEKRKELNNKLFELEEKEEEIARKIKEKNNELLDLKVKAGKIEEGINAKKREKEKLVNEKTKILNLLEKGICPVCGQRIPHDHGKKLLEEVEQSITSVCSEIEQLNKRLQELRSVLLNISEDLNKLDSEKQQVTSERQSIRREIDNIDEEARRLTSIQSRIELLSKQRNQLVEELSRINIHELEEEMRRLENLVKQYENELSILDAKIKQSYLNLRDIEREMGSIEQAIKNIEKEINEIEEITREIEEYEKERKKYEELKSKIEEVESIVDEVEKTVMKILVDEFRTYFYEFLSRLVGDQPVEVIVTDDFGISPRIRIGGAIYSVSSLSGGQSIAVSLAYRLALNMIVRNHSPSLKRAVVILDEPTTGFSREIVRRLRSVLRETGGRDGQVIVVTHDRELIETGDCRLRLILDPSEHKSIVETEECVYASPDYRNLVEKILLQGFSKLETMN